MDSEEIKKIPCFLCGNSIEVKDTVKGKPYFICDPCGLQAFIRRAKGIERLRQWMEGNGSTGSPHKGWLFKGRGGGVILEWISELEGLKAELREVEDRKGLFPDEDTKFIISALKAEIGGVKARIQRGIKSKGRSSDRQ